MAWRIYPHPQGNVHVSSFGFGRTDRCGSEVPPSPLQSVARKVAQMPTPSSGERTFTMPLGILLQG